MLLLSCLSRLLAKSSVSRILRGVSPGSRRICLRVAPGPGCDLDSFFHFEMYSYPSQGQHPTPPTLRSHTYCTNTPMSTRPDSSRQPARGRSRRHSIGVGHRPDPSSLPPSGRRYETRDSNYANRYPSEEEEVNNDDDDDDDDDDDASIVFGESGDASGGHAGMMVDQTVLNLAEETPRPRCWPR